MKRLFACAVVIAGVSLAGAKPRPAPPAPSRCVPGGAQLSLFAVAGKPVACWADNASCLELASSASEMREVPHPAVASISSPELRDESGKPSVCAHACKPLGKHLAAAVAAARLAAATDENAAPVSFKSTSDLALVVIQAGNGSSGIQIWSVAKDRRLTPKPPREYKHAPDKPVLAGVTVQGAALLVHWSACAGPCTMAVLLDRNGANLGDAFPAGATIALDPARIAVAADEADGMLTVIEVKSGRQLGQVRLDRASIWNTTLALLGPDELAVLWTNGSQTRFTRVHTAKPVKADGATDLSDCP